MSRKPDDPVVLRAATTALNALAQRQQDILEHILLERGSPETIANANLVSLERAREWIDEARTRFAEKLALELEHAGVSRSDADRFIELHDNFAAAALRLQAKTTQPGVSTPARAALPAVAACPKCGGEFSDPSGQFGAYAKLASEGRVALMLGCTTCRLLFVPISQATITTVLPGPVPGLGKPR